MESQQKKKTGKGSPSGKVWLAGAGPGDASLLTLKVKKWMALVQLFSEKNRLFVNRKANLCL